MKSLQVLKREQPNLPIIVLTGYAWGIPEMLLGISDGYVKKGDGPSVLLDAVEHVLKFRARSPSAERPHQGRLTKILCSSLRPYEDGWY
jgi:hypothetical protein